VAQVSGATGVRPGNGDEDVLGDIGVSHGRAMVVLQPGLGFDADD